MKLLIKNITPFATLFTVTHIFLVSPFAVITVSMPFFPHSLPETAAVFP